MSSIGFGGPSGPVPDGGGGGGGGGQRGPFLVITPDPITFGNVAAGVAAFAGVILRCLGNNGPIGIQSILISGNASFTTVPPLPTEIAQGASASFQIKCLDANVDGAITGSLNITADDGAHSDSITATIVASVPLQPTPGKIVFPNPQKVGTPSAPQALVVKNTTGGVISISAVTFSNPDFGYSGTPPTFPISINAGATFQFNLIMTPSALGNIIGNMTIVNNAGAGDVVVSIQGFSVLLIPVGIVQNATRGILLGFTYPSINRLKQLDPLDFNSDQDVFFALNGPLWDKPGEEKTIERVEVLYENVGLCTGLKILLNQFRPSLVPPSFDSVTQIITIGDASASGSDMSAFFDITATGEILTFTVFKLAGTGPASIIGIIPHFVDRGEKVESV
jgi:hypothetical protein